MSAIHQMLMQGVQTPLRMYAGYLFSGGSGGSGYDVYGFSSFAGGVSLVPGNLFGSSVESVQTYDRVGLSTDEIDLYIPTSGYAGNIGLTVVGPSFAAVEIQLTYQYAGYWKNFRSANAPQFASGQYYDLYFRMM